MPRSPGLGEEVASTELTDRRSARDVTSFDRPAVAPSFLATAGIVLVRASHMMWRRLAVVVPAVAVLAAGCAHYAWEKTGATPADVAQDSQECNRHARLVADEYDAAFPWPGNWRSPYLYDTIGTFPADRFAEEQRVYSACMRAKGYGLVKQETARGDR